MTAGNLQLFRASLQLFLREAGPLLGPRFGLVPEWQVWIGFWSFCGHTLIPSNTRIRAVLRIVFWTPTIPTAHDLLACFSAVTLTDCELQLPWPTLSCRLKCLGTSSCKKNIQVDSVPFPASGEPLSGGLEVLLRK